MRTPKPHAVLICLSLAFAACAEGGSEDRLRGDVTIAESHHMVGLFGARTLTFPVKVEQMGSDRGILILGSDSKYKIRRGNSESGSASYALSKSGELALIVPRGANQANARYSGAYGLAGNTGVFHFTDRFSTDPSSRLTA